MPHNQSIRKYCRDPQPVGSIILTNVLWYTLERHYKDAKTIISTEVARRKVQAEVTLAAGGNPPKVSDAIGWMVEMAGGKPVDYVAAQLSLTVAAIHATTEALTVALLDLVTYPELITQLRKEIIDVLKDGRWSKQALYKMKLMDSFLKESQRLHPVSGSKASPTAMTNILFLFAN
jgi:cytochrome P450